jgi:glyoxylate/hydroxypyruvate reductase A
MQVTQGPLRISFCARTDPLPWFEALRKELPQAQLEAWSRGAQPADYAIVWAPPQQFFDEQTQLKAVFNMGAGVDALLKRKIAAQLPIVRLNDAGMGVQMAEYVCHALIRHTRQFDVFEAQARAGQWNEPVPLERGHYPVGILGMGVLGERVARAVAALDFPVLAWSRSAKQVPGVTSLFGATQLPAFLAQTRVLVNLLPLTLETENLLNRSTLTQLLPGAYLINVARGRHVVEEDVLALLDSGHLAGATLDVFRTEPLPPEHAFWRHPRVTVTPHIAGRTLVPETVAQIAGKIRALEAGLPIEGMVDRSRGY